MSEPAAVGHLAAFTLSFPLAFWTLALHPERVSTQQLVTWVVMNSSFWGVGLYGVLTLLRYRRRLTIRSG